MAGVRCKTCDQGVLSLQKVHRMSGPAVTIGYILLIPSLLGIAASVFFFLATMIGAASVAQEHLRPETAANLRNVGVPSDVIATLESGQHASEQQKQRLTAEQLNAVNAAETQLDAATGAAGCLGACGTGVAATMATLSFVGGLLGWLLVMKKRVLVCSACQAVTSAS